MYTSSYLALNTALSGVEAAQEELDITGENISNASTAGYEEQTVNLVESDPLDIAGSGAHGAMQLGTGVTATGVTNVGDSYLDASWRSQNATATAASTTQSYLTQLQSMVGGTNADPIATDLSQFWSDWNSLSDNPTSPAAQQVVIDDGQTLAGSINDLSDALTGTASNDNSLLSQSQQQYNDLMQGPSDPSADTADGGEVYDDAFNIAALNQSIVQAQASGQSANTLIDQRSQALDDLSSLGNVSVTNNADGSVDVYFGGVTSTALVSYPPASSAAQIGSADPGNNFGSSTSGWLAALGGSFQTAAATPTSAEAVGSSVGGTLGALIQFAGYPSSGDASTLATGSDETSGSTLSTVMSQLNAFTTQLADEVNTPAIEGTTSTVALDTPFFDVDASGTVTVNSAVQASSSSSSPIPSWVSSTNSTTESAAITAAGQQSSDNDIADDEANNSNGAADSLYQQFVQQVGTLTQAANNAESTQSALQTQITNQRQSVEGVDLSQEMANLITEQQSYQASAKVMNAFSTMMDSLMTVVGQ